MSPTPRARLTSTTTRHNRIAALVYVLVGRRPGRRFLVEELDLVGQRRQPVPGGAGRTGQPARADVALPVDQELGVERRGGAPGWRGGREGAREQRVGRGDLARAVGDHREEDGRPTA